MSPSPTSQSSSYKIDSFSDAVHRKPCSSTSLDLSNEATTLCHSDSERAGHSQQDIEDVTGGCTTHVGAPGKKWEALLAYMFFFVLGSSFLLPWNSLLVSTTYFGSRLARHRFQFSYMNWITVVFTIANVLFISSATSTQQSVKHPTIRIIVSLLLITSLSVILLTSTQYTNLDSSQFFGFLIVVTLFEALGSAYLQTSVIGLSAWFGPNYLQAILSGQGAIGVLVSVVQLLVNINELNSSSDPANPDGAADHIRQSSSTFFGLCTAFCVLALVCFMTLLQLPIYQEAMQRKHAARKVLPDSLEYEDSVVQPLLSSSSSSSVDQVSENAHLPIPVGPKLRVVERKIRLLGLSIFYNFFITLAVFPSITGFILSSHDPAHAHIGLLTTATSSVDSSGSDSRLLLDNWYKPSIFIPLHFVVFNLGDWAGRVLPQLLPRFSKRLSHRTSALYTLSALRTIFIPMFLVCNVDYSSIVLFRSDMIYLVILACFSISNGYLSALLMVAGLEEPSLEADEIDVAATCMSFYLTSGLAAGSLISFAVKAIVFIL